VLAVYKAIGSFISNTFKKNPAEAVVADICMLGCAVRYASGIVDFIPS
jgi:hypothetical protein